MVPPIGSPPAPPPPPMPSAKLPAPINRSELLNSIRQGTKLKKTITNDKSAPNINGKTRNGVNKPQLSVTNSIKEVHNNRAVTNGILNLNDILAAGRPKLRPTGRNLGDEDFTSKNSESYQNDSLKKVNDNFRKSSCDNKNRRPPPGPPNCQQKNSISELTNDNNNVTEIQHATNINILTRVKTTEVLKPSIPPPPSPVISHGKPHVAPKPPFLSSKPIIAQKPTNSHLLVTRAQSMRVPRSPTVVNSTNNFPNGTVRGVPSGLLHFSATSKSTNNLRQLPLIRQGQRPPPPPLPLRCSPNYGIKPPVDPPPPPPFISRSVSLVKSAPLLPSSSVSTNAIINESNNDNNNCITTNCNNTSVPPPPPTRLSSIRTDLEAKFAKQFHSSTEFPSPPTFQNISKKYFSRPATISMKQQAPLPPIQAINTNSNTIELTTNYLTNTSSVC